MVSICRAEDQPPCSDNFSKLLGSLEEKIDKKRINVVDRQVTANGTEEDELWSREKCTTPTAKECRIPETLTCPPAPRKRRGSFSRLPSVRVKEYFVPADLETVFCLDKVARVK